MQQRSDPTTWFHIPAAKEIKVDQFPDGSFSFSVELERPENLVWATITMKTTLPEALVALHQVVHAIRLQAPHIDLTLEVQTMPDQRADRSERPGQCVAAHVAAGLIGILAINEVIIYDPHSQEVVKALEEVMSLTSEFEQSLHVATPLECFEEAMVCALIDIDHVVAVDKGARHRAEEIAAHYGASVIYADKKRVDGKVVGHVLDGTPDTRIYADETIWVTDDLCDGGATFISIAKLLRNNFTFGKLNLYVTHGLFSKGKEELYKHFDEIHALFDYEKQ